MRCGSRGLDIVNAGSARRHVLEEAERTRMSYLVSWFAFGDLEVAEVTRSVELFARHVMPTFAS